MNARGIERSVFSLATPLVDYYVDAELAMKAARLCNDGFAQLVASDPRRFAAWAYLPMQEPSTAASADTSLPTCAARICPMKASALFSIRQMSSMYLSSCTLSIHRAASARA